MKEYTYAHRERDSARMNRNFQKAQREQALERRQWINASRQSAVNTGTTLLSIVLFVGILMTLFRLFVNSNAPVFSFEYFLNFMTQAPSIDISFLGSVSSAISSSDIPKWLQGIISFIWTPVSFLVWITLGIGQLLVYVFYILRYFFGFA